MEGGTLHPFRSHKTVLATGRYERHERPHLLWKWKCHGRSCRTSPSGSGICPVPSQSLKLPPSSLVSTSPRSLSRFFPPCTTTVCILLPMIGIVFDGSFVLVGGILTKYTGPLPLTRMTMTRSSLVCTLPEKPLVCLCIVPTVLVRTRCSISLCSAVLSLTISETH
jgi:hypothetical protein